MKKIIALFLCITLTGSVSVFAEQVNSPNNRGMENQEHTINVRDLSTVSAVSVGEGRINVPSLQKVIDSYFSAREKSFGNFDADASDGDMYNTASDRISRAEQNRADLLSMEMQLEEIEVKKAMCFPYVVSAAMSDEVAAAKIYEWTVIEYTPVGSLIVDVMGYANEHVVFLEKDESQWVIVADEYEEIGFSSSEKELRALSVECEFEASVQQTLREGIKTIDHSNTAKLASQFFEYTEKYQNENINSQRAYNGGLNVEAIVKYADTWVPHFYSANVYMNPSYYNPEYDIGGGSDCQNYVSQCLEAGGVAATPNWYYSSASSVAAAWIHVTALHNLWSNTVITENVSTSGKNIYPGNPVYYLRGDGTGHTTICVGYNSAGVPIINGHNRDMYHMTYQFGGESQYTQKTLKFINSDEYGYNPGNAENLGAISSSVTQSTEMDAESAQWFQFTVPSAGTYRIYSSTHGSNSAIDLHASLYLQSASTNASKTMYMVGYGSDDNSGSGKHFRISRSLPAGTFYICVRGNSAADSGFYKINIERTT